MPKSKVQKQQLVETYVAKITSNPTLLFVRPQAITANESVEIKKGFLSSGASYNVIKNSLFKLALKQLGLPEVQELEFGNYSVVYTSADPATAAKQVKEFAQKYTDRLELAAAVVDGTYMGQEQVKELADMPSFEVIISQIAGILTQPVSAVANVLQDPIASTVSILDQAFQN